MTSITILLVVLFIVFQSMPCLLKEPGPTGNQLCLRSCPVHHRLAISFGIEIPCGHSGRNDSLSGTQGFAGLAQSAARSTLGCAPAAFQAASGDWTFSAAWMRMG
jgi:hypothetical protein